MPDIASYSPAIPELWGMKLGGSWAWDHHPSQAQEETLFQRNKTERKTRTPDNVSCLHKCTGMHAHIHSCTHAYTPQMHRYAHRTHIHTTHMHTHTKQKQNWKATRSIINIWWLMKHWCKIQKELATFVLTSEMLNKEKHLPLLHHNLKKWLGE